MSSGACDASMVNSGKTISAVDGLHFLQPLESNVSDGNTKSTPQLLEFLPPEALLIEY